MDEREIVLGSHSLGSLLNKNIVAVVLGANTAQEFCKHGHKKFQSFRQVLKGDCSFEIADPVGRLVKHKGTNFPIQANQSELTVSLL